VQARQPQHRLRDAGQARHMLVRRQQRDDRVGLAVHDQQAFAREFVGDA
jgi:hypothetical protein